MSKLLKKTDGKLTRDQQARRYALVMLLPALIFLACLLQVKDVIRKHLIMTQQSR